MGTQPRWCEQHGEDEARDVFQLSVAYAFNQHAEGPRKRCAELETAKQHSQSGYEVEGDKYSPWLKYGTGWQQQCGPRCCILLLFVMLALGASYQLWVWFHPAPVSCNLDLIRPQKFKVDVTDFFAPRVSAALQLVLSLSNTNMLRPMLLEQCKVTAYEDETGLNLGSAQQGLLILSPLSTTQVTVALNSLAGSLSPLEQRRLAGALHALDPMASRLRSARGGRQIWNIACAQPPSLPRRRCSLP